MKGYGVDREGEERRGGEGGDVAGEEVGEEGVRAGQSEAEGGWSGSDTTEPTMEGEDGSEGEGGVVGFSDGQRRIEGGMS